MTKKLNWRWTFFSLGPPERQYVFSLKVKGLGRGCKKCLLFFAGLQATQQ